ncbi:MAG: AMP-binding protein, partial [Nitrospinota bacterium]|nr:AMP-binding protein [Nitrospinota bacterium]
IIDDWLYTGDMGYIDEDGFVFLVDRKKEMVITGGLNVYCTEVEGVLRKMEGVADVAIIGEPDPTYGENVVAVIVRAEGSSISEKDVVTYSKSNMGAYKVPKKVVFLEELPKTIIGKVLKREIKKILQVK